MINNSRKCLTALAASLASIVWMTGCDGGQRPDSGASTHTVMQQQSMEVSGAALDEARLNDIELRHFAAYSSYVAVVDAVDDPLADANSFPRTPEDAKAGSFAYLACLAGAAM